MANIIYAQIGDTVDINVKIGSGSADSNVTYALAQAHTGVSLASGGVVTSTIAAAVVVHVSETSTGTRGDDVTVLFETADEKSLRESIVTDVTIS